MSELPRLQPTTVLESHFEFRETPFGVTPDPRFFYDHPLYSEGLAVLGLVPTCEAGAVGIWMA